MARADDPARRRPGPTSSSLVDEDHGGTLAGLLEQVPHASRSTPTNSSTNSEAETSSRALASPARAAREQRLPEPGRTFQQHAAGAGCAPAASQTAGDA